MGEGGRGGFLERSQPTLAFTYTLRPQLGPHRAKMSSGVRKLLGGSGFCMGWSVRFPKSHTNWASFFRPRTLQKSYLVIFDLRSTGQIGGQLANLRQATPPPGPSSPLPARTSPAPGGLTSPPKAGQLVNCWASGKAPPLSPCITPGDIYISDWATLRPPHRCWAFVRSSSFLLSVRNRTSKLGSFRSEE
jgi:hypothetical protein